MYTKAVETVTRMEDVYVGCIASWFEYRTKHHEHQRRSRIYPMGPEDDDLDIRLRDIVQREDFLINQCQKAEELLDDPKKRQQQLDEWHIELRNLEQSYWNVADAVRQRLTLSRRSFLGSISLP